MAKLVKITAYVDVKAWKHCKRQAKHERVSPSSKVNDLLKGAFL